MRRQIILILCALLIAAQPVRAQGTPPGALTEDQIALIRRAGAAAQAAARAEAILTHTVETTETTLNVVSLGQALTKQDRQTLDTTTTRLRGETPNLVSYLRATVEGTDPAIPFPYQYTLEAEVRLVNGVLYVQAARESNTRVGLSDMPLGWIVVRDPAVWPALAALNLGRFLRAESASLLEYPDILAAHAADVSEQVFQDGSRTITIVLRDEGLKAAMADLSAAGGSSAPLPGPYQVADPGAEVTLIAVLGADDALLRRESGTRLAWTGLDLHAMDSTIPSGAGRADAVLTAHTSIEITLLDPAAIEPVSAPALR